MDLRYALRGLRARPIHGALMALTLSIGVAGTASVWGIVERLLLEPLPYASEEEIVAFWSEGAWSEAEFAHVRPDLEGFQSVAAVRDTDVTLVEGGDPARLVVGVSATAEFFDVLGIAPALGYGFQPGHDLPEADPVAVLSHSLWEDLGGDEDIVGRRIELSGVVRTVVGVMPPGFWYPDPSVRIWLAEPVNVEDGSGNYGLIGRLEPGRSLATMQGPLQALTRSLGARFDYPEEWDKTIDASLTPIREELLGSVRAPLLALFGAVVGILLVACINVAALMLGQIDGRGTELAVRSALGAGRVRLLRQLIVESALIGTLAGMAGAGFAVLGLPFLVAALPLGELAANVSIDWTLFVTAIVVALGAATLVALVPASVVVRRDLQPRLTRARTAGVGGRGGRLESALVVAQVALVLLMASGAALLIRSVEKLRAIDTGVHAPGVAVIDVVLPTSLDASLIALTVGELVEAMRGVPGVHNVAATQRLPLRGSSDNWGIGIEGRPDVDATTAFRVVTPNYFETMGIPVLSGRGLVESDRSTSASVNAAVAEGAVVVNRTLADRYFPAADPVGQRIAFMDRWDRIVGVVDDVAESGLTDERVPARYMVHEQVPWLLHGQTLVLRVREGVEPASVLVDARRRVQAVAPSVAVRETTTMENVVARSIGPTLQVRSLLTLLGALALLLGVVGVYGVVTHFVARRRREWGIRLALGVRPPRVVRAVVGRAGALLGGGIALGTLAFIALARLLGSFVYGVAPTDALSLLSAAAVLATAGLLAAWVPARRASRTDPAIVLRES